MICQLFAKMSSVPKMVCLTFIAIGAGAGGYLIILVFLSFFGINLMD
jgi:hypothetical protein